MGESRPGAAVALSSERHARPWKFLAALWTVYLVWGSTYLAIKVSVETMPAFLSAGSRFLLAGALLGAILLATGRSIRVTRRELASSGSRPLAATLGVGVVTLAETRIDSSIAAMIAGSVPLQVISCARSHGSASRSRPGCRSSRSRRARADRRPRRGGRLERRRARAHARRECLVVARLFFGHRLPLRRTASSPRPGRCCALAHSCSSSAPPRASSASRPGQRSASNHRRLAVSRRRRLAGRASPPTPGYSATRRSRRSSRTST